MANEAAYSVKLMSDPHDWRHDVPEVGEFIDVPRWRAHGCVMAVEHAPAPLAHCIVVLLQEHPDQGTDAMPRLRLLPGEWELV